MNIQKRLSLCVLIGVLMIVSGCGSGGSDSSGGSGSSDNSGGSDKHLTLYGIKLGDSGDEIIKKLIDAGIAKPDTKIIESFTVTPRGYEDLGDTFGLFVTDVEIIKALQGFVRPVFQQLFLDKPWSTAYLCYFDKESDIPFALYLYGNPESMRKEADPFRNNPIYQEICEQSGPPDSKQDNDGDTKITEARFCAKWETEDEELAFSIICIRSATCSSKYPEEYNYEIRFFNLAAMRPYIERAEDLIKAYNENNN